MVPRGTRKGFDLRSDTILSEMRPDAHEGAGPMSQVADRIQAFVDYAASLKGDEKSEAQVFCDRLFIGFGHGGYKEAGATLEDRVKTGGKGTSFIDLIWKPRVLIE